MVPLRDQPNGEQGVDDEVGGVAMQTVKEICTLQFLSADGPAAGGDRKFVVQHEENFTHRRPPEFDPRWPVPHTGKGPFAFESYHANVNGMGAGFGGTMRESQAASLGFCESQIAVLRRVGLGAGRRGAWDALAETGFLYTMDPNYLQQYGFTQLGGKGFTLDDGLRRHLETFERELRAAYGAAYRSLPKAQRAELARLRGAYPTTQRAWDVAQAMDDPGSVLELYRRATGAARQLWDTQLAAARAAGLRAPPEGFGRENGHGNNGNDESRVEYRSLQWNIKLLSGRLRAKAARCGGFHRVTDVLRGSIVCETAYQLRDALDFLHTHRAAHIAWVDNRLGSDDDDDDESEENEDEDDENSNAIISDGDDAAGRGPRSNGSSKKKKKKKKKRDFLGGYRDVLVLLCFDGHVCELQLHLKILHEQRKNGHEAYAFLRMLHGGRARSQQSRQKSSSELLIASPDAGGGDDEKKDSEKGGRNGYFTVTADSGALEYRGEFRNDKRNGQGVAIYGDGESYEGEWRDNKRHGEGTYRYRDGAVYVGGYVDDKKQGRGKATFASGNIYEGVSFSFMFT